MANVAFRQRYLNQPQEVSIETLALCNARCNFCPYPTLERKGVEMPTMKVVELIRQMGEFQHPFFFSPFKVNEPFLDARLPGFLRTFEACCPNGKLRLFTNGTPLTGKLIREISELERVEHLWISLNSCDPVEYESIMGLKFERTAQKLDILHANTSFYHPVVVSKVADDDGERNMHFMRCCARRWPRFTARIIKRDGWLGHVPPGSSFVPRQPCSRWFELSVMATGKVALCCMDGTGEFAIGDCTQHTLLDVYNAPVWRERREQLVARHAYEPCARCTY